MQVCHKSPRDMFQRSYHKSSFMHRMGNVHYYEEISVKKKVMPIFSHPYRAELLGHRPFVALRRDDYKGDNLGEMLPHK